MRVRCRGVLRAAVAPCARPRARCRTARAVQPAGRRRRRKGWVRREAAAGDAGGAAAAARARWVRRRRRCGPRWRVVHDGSHAGVPAGPAAPSPAAAAGGRTGGAVAG
eukprot:149801-Chlamydomonas_euryale.AAC.1